MSAPRPRSASASSTASCRLASFTRLILFDKRGTGLSDRQQTPDLDMRADDLRAVLDAIGSTQAVLLGHSEGGALGAFFAATHPDRVSALILYGSAARYAWAPDYPLGMPREEYLAEREEILKHKWLESERLGYDIGFERALLDWIRKHREGWRAARRQRRCRPPRR